MLLGAGGKRASRESRQKEHTQLFDNLTLLFNSFVIYYGRMNERREWTRYPVAYPVEWDSGNERVSLAAYDVSRGGIGVTADDEVTMNDKLNIRLFLKNRMFNVKAIVVYVKRMKDGLYQIGAQFLALPEEFAPIFDKEIEEITQFHRECNLYNRKNLTFRRASSAYLNDTTIPEIEL
jgi:hypothetical protein